MLVASPASLLYKTWCVSGLSNFSSIQREIFLFKLSKRKNDKKRIQWLFVVGIPPFDFLVLLIDWLYLHTYYNLPLLLIQEMHWLLLYTYEILLGKMFNHRMNVFWFRKLLCVSLFTSRVCWSFRCLFPFFKPWRQ